MFYKETPLVEDNIFSANLTKSNEVEQIKFNKSKLYAISGLLINQNIDANISLPNVEEKKVLSDILRTYAEEKKKFNLNLKICNENLLEVTVPFRKRKDVLIYGFQYYNKPRKNKKPLSFTIIMIILKDLVLSGNIPQCNLNMK